ncbi:MAG: caspase family protein [Methylococcales bacterium]
MLKKLSIGTIIVGVTLGFPAQADDRALLIGVGDYKYSAQGISNLPGIDLDLEMMDKAVRLMGFDAIKTLTNDQATLKNVVGAMEDFLINGVKSDDRILIYFSGHGTRIPDRNGDEEDNADEVLIMHDAQPTTINGKPSLTGVLVDDKFDEILKKIPSDNTLVLIDACNSGTATKSIMLSRGTLGEGIETQPKFVEYAGIPITKDNSTLSGQKSADVKYVAISAAGDTEYAQATKKGSLFTLGLLKAIKGANQDTTSPLTPASLKQQTTAYIKAENKKAPFTPRLSGNLQLAEKMIKIRASDNGNGQVWQQLVALTEKAEPLKISINQPDYAEGDILKITIDNNKAGFLSVINVGPTDQATVLFPNRYHKDGKVQGTITIPTSGMRFEIFAPPPFGPSMIVAFLTDKPLDLYNSGDGVHDSKDIEGDLFLSLSELGLQTLTRNFGVREKQESSEVKAGKVITRICPSKCN